MSPVDGSGTLYEKIYTGIQPGTYQFKVVPDTLDGMWKFPLDYGDEDGGNYIITILNSDGTTQFKDVQVRILFDASKGTIDVTTSPAEALQMDRYALSGGTNLMGDNRKWSTTDPEMKYDKKTGHYLYTLENVRINDTAQIPTVDFLPNISYAYKIVPYGEDKGENKYFILRGLQLSYNIKFDYNPKTEETILTAYDDEGNDVSDSVLSYDVKPTFYSVIGDSILTGYAWDTNQSIEAAYYGLMDDTDNDGIYEKTYKINVPSGGAVANYSFKVAANGTFNSGMSWGPDGFGDNHNVVVSVQSNDPSILEAYLTIYFDSKTGEITYKTDPESVSAGIDDSVFVWYIAGTYMLRNNNGFTYDTTVYDTVRDITSGFTFTCGENTDERGLTWSIDTEYNKASDFKNKLSFNIFYTQEETSATGTFETDIIDLEVQPLYESDYKALDGADHIKILAQYFVNKFMPGKQWLKVTSVGYGYSQSFRDWKVNNLEYNNYLYKTRTRNLLKLTLTLLHNIIISK